MRGSHLAELSKNCWTMYGFIKKKPSIEQNNRGNVRPNAIFYHLPETLSLILRFNRDSPIMSSSESKNMNRTIGSMSKVCRKQSSERTDLIFKDLSHEIGCLEISLEDEGENGTKEMNEKSIKSPIMMNNFAYHSVQQYKMDANKIITIGLIISGKAKNFSQYLCGSNFFSDRVQYLWPFNDS